MDDSSEDNAINMNDYTMQFRLAKLMLLKYGAMHGFHELQLATYPIACCNISIDGNAEVDVDKKTVVYNIFTKKAFFKEGKETKERHKWSVLRFFNVPADLYEKEKELAFNNLNNWTKNLLWPETKVILYVDGERYKKSSLS